ncbi:TetR/AcrR family transcriptional regulator [Rhodococcus qingshengii]|uniref:TetR/AcrR family transcriptional regulator n=1 Tax=Rhodococcus qingshengii TaxID=334542 RepID=UPI0036025E65
MFNEHVQSRAERRANTRARVLVAAEQLFRDTGFDATTIRDIAALAQVSTGTVMAVGDKDSLLVTVYDEWISAVHRERQPDLTDNAGPLAAADAPHAILNLFTPFVQHFARDPALSRAYAAIIVSGRVESQIFKQLRHALITEIEATLVRAGLVHERAERGAHVIYFGYLGLLMSAGADDSDSATASDFEHFLNIINFVTTSPNQGELS